MLNRGDTLNVPTFASTVVIKSDVFVARVGTLGMFGFTQTMITVQVALRVVRYIVTATHL